MNIPKNGTALIVLMSHGCSKIKIRVCSLREKVDHVINVRFTFIFYGILENIYNIKKRCRALSR